MASNYIETKHELLLRQLIEEAGLECNIVMEESVGSEILENIVEEEAVKEEEKTEIEEVAVVVAKTEVIEEVHEIEPALFPSPSLRRMIPDKIRKIEEQNRIRVLPQDFITEIDPTMIPKINQTPHQKYIDILADMVGCKSYKSSLAEFWFLDTLANLLRRAQEDSVCRSTQALLIVWFCEWIKEIQQFDAADRQRMLRRFKDNMLTAAKFIAEEMHIPSPGDVGVFYKALEEMSESFMVQTRLTASTAQGITHVIFEKPAFECAMRDLVKITHYIFDLFSTDYQYDLVRSVFCFSPDYIRIDTPYQLQIPKRMFIPLKPKSKKEKSPKKDKGKDKGRKREPDTAEYLALMELKAKDDREFEEQEDRIREDFNRCNSILPLTFAATQELFDKYWPPPPPEPEPEIEPEPKSKAKGKAKSDTVKGKK